ncbi:uncharacterized protein Dana_GF22621 [Drosophila ananassae]|uniref:Uncharacterized protein n=1 Tax=Drosophila ananassae TaxID=7217 RepID=B3MW42_DROAN|nr:3'-5' RNA helicase YTHDC2 [Drosophila ananassae]EDV35187.1 uncharacterized protein Dana_GF22621 [Drosophila ananassae]
MADSPKEQNQRGKRRRTRKKKGPAGAAASAVADPSAAVAAQEGFSGKKKRNKDKNNVSDVGTVEEEISRVEQNILRAVVTDFMQSTEQNVQLRGLSRLQRSHVHRVAQSMGLKTASKGFAEQRVLTITRPAVVDPQQGVVQKPRIAVSSTLLEILAKSSGEMDMNLLRRCSMHRRPKSDRERERELERECERDYLNRPNNGLVGVALVPPPSQCRNRSLVQERISLPIYRHRSKILNVLQNEQVLIIKGATGSGKSTQLPQYLLEWATNRRRAVRVVVSQPRRIAATSVSERIANERGESQGSTVGYQIRMNSRCSAQTVLTFTTSGCLLRVLAMDGEAFFTCTSHLVIDEVHERDLDTDFLLLAAKLELKKNPHLRLILMSATMDLGALSAYFGGATVLDVEGRSFEVKTFHLEKILSITGYMTAMMEPHLGEMLETEDPNELLEAYNASRTLADGEIDNDLIVSLLELLLHHGDTGAVIVYLPGYHDMTVLQERIEELLPKEKIKVLLLHSQVDSNEQRKAFRVFPNIRLKIVLSTNIGQTSITIPDLVYVIDTGRSKMKTYDPNTDASQLATAWISQADAKQRAGRAGRLRNGICYRLYSQARHDSMSLYTIPEMMRRTLDEICLLAKLAGPEQPIAKFLSQALDPPQTEAVVQACARLVVIGILQSKTEKITPLGKIVAELPVGVQLGKSIVHSIYYRCLGSMTIIAAYHSVRDPFVLPVDRTKKSNKQNARHAFAGNCTSDSMSAVSLYEGFVMCNKMQLSTFCEENRVCRYAMEMFVSAVNCLRDSVRRIFRSNQAGERMVTECDNDPHMIRMALAAGLYPKVAFIDRGNKNHLVSEGDTCMQISRNSCLLSRKKLKNLPSDWVLYVEKSRNADQRSSLENNTMVSALMLALACGKEGDLEEREEDGWVLCLDSWVRLIVPLEFGRQLLKLRRVIQWEVNEIVEKRRLNLGNSLMGPKLVHRMLQVDTSSICVAEGRSPSAEPDCDKDN